MHVLAPQPGNDLIPIFFNVDSSVGHNAQNSSPVDIMLVQFLMRKAAERDAAGIQPDRKQRMLRVSPDGRCGPITIDGIRAVQETMKDKHPGTTVDGRVSKARGTEYGGGFWTIVSLSAAVRTRYPESWPRIQDLPACPGALRTEVIKSL